LVGWEGVIDAGKVAAAREEEKEGIGNYCIFDS
jgi:hypothetical protein